MNLLRFNAHRLQYGAQVYFYLMKKHKIADKLTNTEAREKIELRILERFRFRGQSYKTFYGCNLRILVIS